MLITANKQKRQMHYIREGAFAYLQTVITNETNVLDTSTVYKE